LDDEKQIVSDDTVLIPPAPQADLDREQNAVPTISKPETEAKVDASSMAASHEALPSHVQKQRWPLSKRLQTVMDDVLSKAMVASQRVNTYTGTDYSGIEALRQAIIEQGRPFLRSHPLLSLPQKHSHFLTPSQND